MVHLNDTLKELGSKINRHAPIGTGYIFKDKQNLINLITILNYKMRKKKFNLYKKNYLVINKLCKILLKIIRINLILVNITQYFRYH